MNIEHSHRDMIEQAVHDGLVKKGLIDPTPAIARFHSPSENERDAERYRALRAAFLAETEHNGLTADDFDRQADQIILVQN